MDEPIPVQAHATPVPDQLWSGMRSVIMALTAFGLGRGWLKGDEVTLIGVVAGVLGPFIIGQLKVRRRSQELTTIAVNPDVPDSVVQLRNKK